VTRRAAWLLVAALAIPRAAAAQPSPVEERIAAWVESHEGETQALLERLVNINSGTMNHAGVRAVGEVLRGELDALGFTTRWIDMPEGVNRAGHLFAEREGRAGAPRVLLIGHIDTVFEPDHPFQRFERQGDRARGPGAADMKGGDVVMVTALGALAAVGALDGLSVTVALIGDEESAGLPLTASRGDLIEAGRRADVALGFEAGDPNRGVVARRGSSAWTLRVTGREGHSSGVFGPSLGSGAIYEMARILYRFHEEVREAPSLTFNPGIVLGGTELAYDAAEKRGTAAGKTNVVAQTAIVDGDLRFLTEEEKEEAREEMREIVAASLPGTSAEITFEDKYPAMPPTEGNRRVLELYGEVSEDLGLGPVTAFDPLGRGAADISFVAPHVDGIDGLGPWGTGAHSPNETLNLPSLVVTAQRAAVMLHRLAAEDVAVGDDAAARGPAVATPAAVVVGGDTLVVPPPDTLAPDLASQILHHAVPGHSTCAGQTGLVAPGAKACLMLLYLWRGVEPAPDVKLSLAAPEGVALTGASREPTARSPAGWRWDLGTIPPNTVGSILVQIEVAPGAAPGSALRFDSYAASDVAEEPPGNNGSWVVVSVSPPPAVQ
jgi:glutamate carboxypeptidase